MHLYCVISSSKGVDWHIIDENWSCESLKSLLSRKNKSVKVHSCSFKNINFKNYGHFWDFAAENVWLDGFWSIFWIFSFFQLYQAKVKAILPRTPLLRFFVNRIIDNNMFNLEINTLIIMFTVFTKLGGKRLISLT